MTAEDYGLARRMWHQLEPVHAVLWYAPEVFAEAAALGYEVKTRWPSYFAWRLAPLGAVGPRLAASACYSFSPHMVGAHVPAAWAVASPPQILAARERAVDRMYRALLGDLIDSPGLLPQNHQLYLGLVDAQVRDPQPPRVAHHVAHEIGVSEITVKIHRGHITRKMGAKSLAELVRQAEALGISRTKA